MSYIRCTNNPEALYIYGDGKLAHVSMGSDNIGSLPISALNGLIKRYVESYMEDCKYAGAEIKEVWIDGTPKTQLSYKDKWKCVMWGVTWDYVALSNVGRIIKEVNYFKSRNINKKK